MIFYYDSFKTKERVSTSFFDAPFLVVYVIGIVAYVLIVWYFTVVLSIMRLSVFILHK